MLLIHTALHCEAAPFIARGKLRPCGPRVYSDGRISLIVGGVGAQKTEAALRHYCASDPERSESLRLIVNTGICGAPPETPLGTVFSISKIHEAANGRCFDLPDWNLVDLPNGELTTVPRPQLVGVADACRGLVDMEGAAFIGTARECFPGAKWLSIKVVSDHMDGARLTKTQVQQLMASCVDVLFDLA